MGIRLTANAKINLSIEIIGKRQDGYHDLSMIMQSIDIYDKIEIETNQTQKINLDTSISFGAPKDNIAYKAAAAFFESTNLSLGCDIKLQKYIPAEAGLAGGSTDAAAVLIGLNRLTGSTLTDNQLISLATRLGADVPFCLFGGTMLAEGIGNILTPLPFADLKLLIVKPKQSVSTKDLFRVLEQSDYSSGAHTERLAQAIRNGTTDLGPLMVNKMYPKSLLFAPDMQNIVQTLEMQFRCEKALMSGSGSTIFAIFKEDDTLDSAYDYFSKQYKQVYKTRTAEKSIKYEE